MNPSTQKQIQRLVPLPATLSDLRIDPFYDFLCAADKELRLRQAESFAALPMVVVDSTGVIMAGHEFYRLFQSRGLEEITVLRAKLSKAEALCLNFNVSNPLFTLNLLEKLRFTQRILTELDARDVYHHVNLDLNINRQLQSHLNILLSDEFQYLLMQDRVNLKTALRICDLEAADRIAVIGLFQQIAFTSSQCLHILEMLEEICFRDKTPVRQVLETIDIESVKLDKKPQPAVLDALAKHRYPMYSQAEEEWQERIEALNLPGNMKVRHAPFFEKKNIEVTTLFEDFGQLERFSKKITDD